MPQLTIQIPPALWPELQRAARRDLRDIRRQAEFFVRQGLERGLEAGDVGAGQPAGAIEGEAPLSD